MPGPERFGARPTQDVVRGSYLANECLARALIPGILVPPNVKNNLGVGVCLDKLRGEDRASRVCDRRAVAEDLIELRGSDLAVVIQDAPVVRVHFELPPLQIYPLVRVEGLLEQNVSAMVGVVIAQGDEGLLQRLGAGARKSDAENLHRLLSHTRRCIRQPVDCAF